MHANRWHIEDAATCNLTQTGRRFPCIMSLEEKRETTACLVKKGEIVLKSHRDALAGLAP